MKVTYKRALEALETAVQANGENFVYDPPNGGSSICVYTHDGKPSCIVGHALTYLGVPFKVIRSLDTDLRTPNLASPRVLAALEEAGFPLTKKAENLLDLTQMEQDAGLAWGESVNRSARRVAQS